MIKYEVKSYLNSIEEVKVERETDSSVWVEGRRRAKKAGYCGYFDTWEEAKNSLLNKAQKDVDAARSRLQRANSKLGQVKSLKKPRAPE